MVKIPFGAKLRFSPDQHFVGDVHFFRQFRPFWGLFENVPDWRKAARFLKRELLPKELCYVLFHSHFGRKRVLAIDLRQSDELVAAALQAAREHTEHTILYLTAITEPTYQAALSKGGVPIATNEIEAEISARKKKLSPSIQGLANVGLTTQNSLRDSIYDGTIFHRPIETLVAQYNDVVTAAQRELARNDLPDDIRQALPRLLKDVAAAKVRIALEEQKHLEEQLENL